MLDMTPEGIADRSQRARIAAHSRWSQVVDRQAATEAARKALDDKWEKQVPAEITDPVQRMRAAENLKAAHYARMAYLSAQARRKKAA